MNEDRSINRFREISEKSNPSFSDRDKETIFNTVAKFKDVKTASDRPGMLFGHIQSGKTRSYIGIIAHALDEGFDYIVVLTKGTKLLEKQTANRIKKSFQIFDEIDDIHVYDINEAEREFTKYELNQKLIFVVKKQSDNLKKLINIFSSDKFGVSFSSKNVLLLDDEADFASVGFKNKKDELEANTTLGHISDIRNLFNRYSFLQITATPYSIYLQPESIDMPDGTHYKPIKPAFTTLVPPGDGYIGGDVYFKDSLDEENLSSFFNVVIDPNEFIVLEKEDKRRLSLSNILHEHSLSGLRNAIIDFLVGGAIRQLQQKKISGRVKKYSFLIHTDMKRSSHAWQNEIVKEIFKQLTLSVEKSIGNYESLIKDSYDRLIPSIKLADLYIPSFESIQSQFKKIIIEEHYKTIVVNQDKDIESLTNEKGELALDVPFTVFIGGQILDRGITIENLLGFYYGRSPKTSQQDTTLQHARMYGYRNKDDLTVTRIYTSPNIYDKMKRIYEYDTALRNEIEKGSDGGVIFLTKDLENKIRPCSPNKLKLSNITTLKPNKRILPIGFQATKRYPITPIVKEIDATLYEIFDGNFSAPKLVQIQLAIDIMELISKTLSMEIAEGYDFNWQETNELMKYLSNLSNINKGQVWLSVAHDRNISRQPPQTMATRKYSDSPDTPTERKIAKEVAKNNPILFLLKQQGNKEQGWKGYPFYWPVLLAQGIMSPVIYCPENNING